MITALVGYTGFVGSNLNRSYNFTHKYNTKNIDESYNLQPDLLVYAGVKATKFLANSNPAKDMENIHQAFDNIQKIKPKKLVLISTIDVYKKPIRVDENTIIQCDKLHPYGVNRYFLEQCVRKEYPNSLIIRLPGLFGENLQKNFIYDFIHQIPVMLNSKKYEDLCLAAPLIKNYYRLQSNGFYRCITLSNKDEKVLKCIFDELHFSALNFTDSRGIFQFYPLYRLWNDIKIALENDLHLINMATEPVAIQEIYQMMTGKNYINHIDQIIPYYDFRTIFSTLYGGEYGYICKKETILDAIKKYIQEQSK